MKIEAVVFDMDGTILDTGNLWIQSALEVNKKFGFSYGINEIKSYIGTGKKDDYCLQIKSVFNEKISNGELKTKKGFFELINFLKKNKVKIALASSSKLQKIEKRFNFAKFDMSIFDCIISGENVKNNKPNPEIYILTCKKLGIDPQNIIAVEDSDGGIASASGAGLFSVLIPDVCEPSPTTTQKANKIFSSFDDLKEFIKQNLKNE